MLVAAAGLGLLTACAANPEPAAQAAPSQTAPPPTAPAPTTAAATTAAPATSATTVAPTTTTRGVRGSGQPVTIAFAGDVHFEGGLRARLTADPDRVLAPIAPVLSAADLAIVNLETAVTERGSAVPKTYTFRAPAVAFRALQAAGVDAASMANNHGMDFGAVGLLDSLDAASAAGFPVIGAGRDEAEAYRPWVTEVHGQRIAVLAATQVLDSSLIRSWTASGDRPGLAAALDLERLEAEIRAVRPSADTVVVFLHWGRERETCPTERQVVTARRLVDAGADIVVGAHTHRVMGAGRMGDALVGYGLGNFVWYREAGESGRSGVLEVTVTGRQIDAYRWIPARIQGGVPRPLTGASADAWQADWEQRRGCTGLAP